MSIHHVGIIASHLASPPPTGDPYFASVTLLTEFNQYLKDESSYNRNMFIKGAPNRKSVGKYGIGAWGPDISSSYDAGAMVDSNTDFALSNSDFCIEFWAAKSSEPTSTMYLASRHYTTTGARGWILTYNPSPNTFTFTVSTTGSADFGTASFDLDTDGVNAATMWDGNYHHIAVVRSSGTIKIYIDGYAGAASLSIGTTALWDSSPCKVVVGAKNNSSTTKAITGQWTGTIDEFRFSIGVPRYTAAFNGSLPAKFGRNLTDDVSFASVKLLMGFDDRFPVNNFGSAAISITGVSLPADNSWFDADGLVKESGVIGLYWPNNVGFDLGSGDFTLEAFGIYKSAGTYSATAHLVGCWDASGGAKSWRFSITGTGVVSFEYSTDGSSTITVPFGSGFVAGTYYSLAVSRVGANIYLYLDGVQVATSVIGSGVAIFSTISAAVRLGFWANSSNGDGPGTTQRIKGLRITKGVGRYSASTYTLPTLPLPISA